MSCGRSSRRAERGRPVRPHDADPWVALLERVDGRAHHLDHALLLGAERRTLGLHPAEGEQPIHGVASRRASRDSAACTSARPSASTASCSSSSANMRSEAMGVRSSCETVATKSVRSALSRRSRACGRTGSRRARAPPLRSRRRAEQNAIERVVRAATAPSPSHRSSKNRLPGNSSAVAPGGRLPANTSRALMPSGSSGQPPRTARGDGRRMHHEAAEPAFRPRP